MSGYSIPKQDTLLKLLDYDELTGELTWKARSPDDFVNHAAYQRATEKFGTSAVRVGKNDNLTVIINGSAYRAAALIVGMKSDLKIRSPTMLDGNRHNLTWDNLKHNLEYQDIERAKRKGFKYNYWCETEGRWKKFPPKSITGELDTELDD